jgi:hypothetical protein
MYWFEYSTRLGTRLYNSCSDIRLSIRLSIYADTFYFYFMVHL